MIYIGMSFFLVIVIIVFKYILISNVIDSLLVVVGYIYGLLLGFFVFGIFIKFKVRDNYVWIVILVLVVIIFVIGNIFVESLGGY